MKLKIRSDRVEALRSVVPATSRVCLAIGNMSVRGLTPGVSSRDFKAVESVLASYLQKSSARHGSCKKPVVVCDVGPVGPYHIAVVRKRVDSTEHDVYRMGSADIYMFKKTMAIYVQHRMPPKDMSQLMAPLKAIFDGITPVITKIDYVTSRFIYNPPSVVMNVPTDTVACAPRGQFCHLSVEDGSIYLSTGNTRVMVGVEAGDTKSSVLTGYWDGEHFTCTDVLYVCDESVGNLDYSARLSVIQAIISPIDWCSCIEYGALTNMNRDLFYTQGSTSYVYRSTPTFCFEVTIVQVYGYPLYELRTDDGEIFTGTDDYRLPKTVPISTGYSHIVHWPEGELIDFQWKNDGFLPIARSKAISAIDPESARSLWTAVNELLPL